MFNYSDFTNSYELFSQALKSFDYVLSGSKRKTAWRRRMQTKRQLKQFTRNVHPSFADFRPGLGVNCHILLTQNWLWESSLSLLSLWCILFWIKFGLFRENLNLQKYLQPKNWWSSPCTFWHRLIYIHCFTLIISQNLTHFLVTFTHILTYWDNVWKSFFGHFSKLDNINRQATCTSHSQSQN